MQTQMVKAWKGNVKKNMTENGQADQIPGFDAIELEVHFDDDILDHWTKISAGDLVATLRDSEDKTVKLTVRESD